MFLRTFSDRTYAKVLPAIVHQRPGTQVILGVRSFC